MDKTHILNKYVGEASRITIAIHTHPDGDAIGSGTALLTYLASNRGKDTALIVPDSIPSSLKFITTGSPEGKVLVFGEDTPAAVNWIDGSDLIFCLDCNSFERTAGLEKHLRESKARKVLLDHHLNPESEAFDLVFSKTDISSASELLFWTLKEMPDIGGETAGLPEKCAAALLTGMTTDTNNFANSVFPSTLAMASELIEAGVDRDGILCELYDSYRENRLRLMGFLLSEKMHLTEDGVAYIILDKATQNRFGMEEGETEGFVNLPLSIAKVRMSLFLTEENDRFRVSLRSKKGTSANACSMAYFNGGGHELAAGGRLEIGKDLQAPEDAEAYILKVTKLFFNK